MEGFPPVYILLTTYKRTDTALRTIRNIKEKLVYPNYGWYISDDGSSDEHVGSVMEEIGTDYHRYFYNSNRKGVGHGMNYCLQHLWSMGIELVVSMEDDWELNNPLDLVPYVKTLIDHPENGLIRFGYLAEGLLAENVFQEGLMYWNLKNNGFTYRYAGHPHLKHKRFHDIYGYYDEGWPAGVTELSMCGKTNLKQEGPNLLYPADCKANGLFSHIGTVSLKDIKPGEYE